MEIVLALAGLSFVGLIVLTVLLSAALRSSDSAQSALPVSLPQERSRFFDDASLEKGHTVPPVPVEVLLLQIERHVRLEQAAAESFHQCPTVRSLHIHTTSPLVH
jgi:hypothetical protein